MVSSTLCRLQNRVGRKVSVYKMFRPSDSPDTINVSFPVLSPEYREYTHRHTHSTCLLASKIYPLAHCTTHQVTTMEYVGVCAKIVHTATTNMFFGAAAYVNIVETPARKSLRSADAIIDHFQASFPRAANMMKPLAAAGFLSGLLGKISAIIIRNSNKQFDFSLVHGDFRREELVALLQSWNVFHVPVDYPRDCSH